MERRILTVGISVLLFIPPGIILISDQKNPETVASRNDLSGGQARAADGGPAYGVTSQVGLNALKVWGTNDRC